MVFMLIKFKNTIRAKVPATYKVLCRIKDAVVPPERWGNVYSGEHPYRDPEPSFRDLVKLVPSHIDTILDVGCGSGRNFIPFNGKYRLWGIDLPPYERMKWVDNFANLSYEQCSLQEFTKRLEHNHYDLSRTLVHTHSCLGYVSQRWQERFYRACLKSGCRNFHFEEYPKSHRMPKDYFQLSDKDFTNNQWRKNWWEPVAHYRFE